MTLDVYNTQSQLRYQPHLETRQLNLLHYFRTSQYLNSFEKPIDTCRPFFNHSRSSRALKEMSHSHSPAPSSYGDCVASLRTSLTLLESSVDTLGSGVADLPRLSSVLKTVRVCDTSHVTQPAE